MWSGPSPAPTSFHCRDRSSSASHTADAPWASVSCAGLTGRPALSRSLHGEAKNGNRFFNKETPPGRGEDLGERRARRCSGSGPHLFPDPWPASRLQRPFTVLFTVCKDASDWLIVSSVRAGPSSVYLVQERCSQRSVGWGRSPGSLPKLVCQLCICLWLGHLTSTEEVAEKVGRHIWFLEKGLLLRK